MTDQNELYLAFAKLNIEQAIYVLDSIIENEMKQDYEKTADLMRIQDLKEIWGKLGYEVMPMLKDAITPAADQRKGVK